MFRLRKSKQIAPGLRLTLTKSGLSARVGVRGLGTSVSTSGRRTTSAGIPGSGVYYVNSKGGGTRRGSTNSKATSTPTPAPERAVPGAGWFASANEKAYRAGAFAYVTGDTASAFTHFRAARGAIPSSADLLLAILSAEQGEPAEALSYLEPVIKSETALPDRYMAKYFGRVSLSLQISLMPGLLVTVVPHRFGATLLLAQLYRHQERYDGALQILEPLGDQQDPIIRLLSASIHSDKSQWDRALQLTDGAENRDDLSLASVIVRAIALRGQGLHDAALEMHRQSLKSKARSEEVLTLAYYERARTYEAQGQLKRARKDLETVYSRDTSFADVAERLKITNESE